jgi:hypothetical protein
MPMTASGQAEGGVATAADGIVAAPAAVSAAASERRTLVHAATFVFLPPASPVTHDGGGRAVPSMGATALVRSKLQILLIVD